MSTETDMPRRALIIIDMQGEYVDGPLQIQYPPREVSVPNALAAIDTASEAGLPIVVVQHQNPSGAAVFGDGSPSWELDPVLAQRLDPAWHRVQKQYASVFAGTGLAEWLRAQGVDTVTFVGFMTNNCVIASAAEAAAVGMMAEVLADATGAIHLANAIGFASAQTVHETLMALMHSNFAAVASTKEWIDAVRTGVSLPKSNLIDSATKGREVAARQR